VLQDRPNFKQWQLAASFAAQPSAVKPDPPENGHRLTNKRRFETSAHYIWQLFCNLILATSSCLNTYRQHTGTVVLGFPVFNTVFLGSVADLDPLVRYTDPDLDPSIIKEK
jgi:hypothetical protein